MDNLPSLAGATADSIQKKEKYEKFRIMYAGINTFKYSEQSNPIRKILEAKQANHFTA